MFFYFSLSALTSFLKFASYIAQLTQLMATINDK